MTLKNQFTTHAELLIRDDGIYILRFKDASKQAVDDLLMFMESIWIEHIQSQVPIFMLIEPLADFNIPLSYSIFQSLKLRSRYKNLPNRRIAMMVNQTYMLNLLDNFFQMVRSGIDYRYFSTDKHDLAIDWLKEKI